MWTRIEYRQMSLCVWARVCLRERKKGREGRERMTRRSEEWKSLADRTSSPDLESYNSTAGRLALRHWIAPSLSLPLSPLSLSLSSESLIAIHSTLLHFSHWTLHFVFWHFFTTHRPSATATEAVHTDLYSLLTRFYFAHVHHANRE